MILERVRCTNCGAEFESIDTRAATMRCSRIGCGATFVIRQAKEFAKVQVDHDFDIRNLRSLLEEAVARKDFTAIGGYARNIRKYIPDDYYAGFCDALSQKVRGKPDVYMEYLRTIHEMTEEDCNKALDTALMFFLINEEEALRKFIRLNYPLEEQRKKEHLVSNAADRLFIDEARYADIPRDLFICHSSSDIKLAERVYDMLTADGNSCWIASWNLPPDSTDYWEKITDAIARCRAILVISSRQCMLREDPKREMQIAEKRGLLRLEYKIDDVQHTTFFKYFFNGLMWVKGSPDGDESSFEELRTRVYRLLHDEYPQEEKVIIAPVPTIIDAPSVTLPNAAPVDGVIKPRAIPGVTAPGVEQLLRRAQLFMEDGDFKSALDYIEKALDIDPEHAPAYIARLQASLSLKSEDELGNAAASLEQYGDYQKAVRFSEGKQKQVYIGYNQRVLEQQEAERRESNYQAAANLFGEARNEAGYLIAANGFQFVSGYKDADERALASQAKAKEARLAMLKSEEEARARQSQRDAERADLKEKERLVEEKRKFRNKRLIIIVTPIIAVVIAIILLVMQVIIPRSNNQQGMVPTNNEHFTEEAAPVVPEGTRYTASEKGFAGPVAVFVTVKDEGIVTALEIGDEQFNETENYGAGAKESGFIKQFVGKMLPVAIEDIDAVSGATITTKAVIAAINRAYEEKIVDASAPQAAQTPEAAQVTEAAETPSIPEGARTETSSSKGYGGPVAVTIWLNDDDTIAAMTIGDVDFAETQGIGSRAQEPEFINGFIGKKVPLANGDVDVLAGATVTSQAVIKAVNKAAEKLGIAAETAAPEASAEPVQEPAAPSDEKTATSSSKGYAGPVAVTITLNDDNTISALSVGDDDFAETDGLGSRTKDAEFTERFIGKKVPLADGDVDVLAGATVTSQAVINAVNKAAEILSNTSEEDSLKPTSTSKKLKVGDTITFGHYEQDNNLSNGKEKILWRVLKVEGDSALLISEQNLDTKPYHHSYTPVTWETCSLREWLNSSFLNSAFTDEERESILTTSVQNDEFMPYTSKVEAHSDGGRDTQDKVFLLSTVEAENLFAKAAYRVAKNTAYAKAQGAFTSDIGAGWWWLRSPGINQSYAGIVNPVGSVRGPGDYILFDGSVRPALWLDLASDIF